MSCRSPQDINTAVNEPELVQCRIDIDADHYPDTANDHLGVTGILASHPIDGTRVAFFERCVVEDEVISLALHYLSPDIVLDQIWDHTLAIDGVVAKVL